MPRQARLDAPGTLRSADGKDSETSRRLYFGYRQGHKNQKIRGRKVKVFNNVPLFLPKSGKPAPMPKIPLDGKKGVLKLGTAAITEPFSFVDASGKIVGFDIELATYVAQKLGKKLEIVNMDFGSLIPALTAGKVDMIAACITITEERAKSVLFSEPYYKGGIGVLVRAPKQK
jgi:ABC-type amino acid transport substrate-binding protein